MRFCWRRFNDLDNRQLYDMLRLRQEVFILEQNCLYADIDGEDHHHWHLLAYNAEQFTGYLRVIPAEHHPSGCVAIGRVVIPMKFRGAGLASPLMKQALDFCDSKYSQQVIFLSAQQYLHDFYKKLGFTAVGEVYLEDGIPHIDMKKTRS